MSRLTASRSGWLAIGAFLCGLGAWLFLPARAGSAPDPEPALRVMIVDASNSCTGPRPRWVGGALRFLDSETTEALRAGQEVLVLRVGAHVRRLFGPGTARDFQRALFAEGGEPLPLIPDPLESLGSDLAGAYALVDELLAAAPREPGEIVLYGDGTWTGPDPAPFISRLASLGETLRYESLPAASTHRVAVTGLRAPRQLAGGAPFAAVAEISWSPPLGKPCEGATLHAVLEGMGARSEQNLQLTPPAGLLPTADGTYAFELRLDWPPQLAGNHRLSIEVHHPDDRVAFDDAASTRLHVANGRTLLVVARELETARAQAELWSPSLPGIVFEAIALEQLPLRLPEAAGVWTMDLGPTDLPEAHLAAAIRSGTGWFATGTGGLLRGFGRGPLAEVLPLQLREHEGGHRDIVLAVDGSGSMMGRPFARVCAAITELLMGLTARDDLELRLFQQRLGAPIIRAEGRDVETLRLAVQDLLTATVPGGSTGIPTTVNDLIEVRRVAPRRSLIVFITDGHSSVGEGYLDAGHRDALEAVGSELVILTTGSAQRPPNQVFLRPLLRPGESIVDAGDLSALTELLVERVRAESMAEPSKVQWVPATEHVPGTFAHDWISAAIVPGARTPVGVSGELLDVEAVPGADEIWRVRGEALLAVHDVGLGRVAACGTGPSASPELFNDVFRIAPLLRALTQAPLHDEVPRARWRSGDLVITGVPATWPVAVTATLSVPLPGLEAQFHPPEFPLGATELCLPLHSPGGDPRTVRRGELPAPAQTRPAGETWTVQIGPENRPLLRQAIASPPVREHRAASLGPWPQSVSGGREAGSTREGHPAAPWLLGAGWLILALAGLLPRVSGQGVPGLRR